jgi:hypothetical protein
LFVQRHQAVEIGGVEAVSEAAHQTVRRGLIEFDGVHAWFDDRQRRL